MLELSAEGENPSLEKCQITFVCPQTVTFYDRDLCELTKEKMGELELSAQDEVKLNVLLRDIVQGAYCLEGSGKIVDKLGPLAEITGITYFNEKPTYNELYYSILNANQDIKDIVVITLLDLTLREAFKDTEEIPTYTMMSFLFLKDQFNASLPEIAIEKLDKALDRVINLLVRDAYNQATNYFPSFDYGSSIERLIDFLEVTGGKLSAKQYKWFENDWKKRKENNKLGVPELEKLLKIEPKQKNKKS